MYPRWFVPKSVFACCALSIVLAACSRDGRDLAEAQDWQTTTTRPAPPTSAPIQGISDSGLTLSSSDFEPGGATPSSARCDGANVFPQLQIENVPARAVELAVTLSDQTDPDLPVLLWLMGGISPDRTRLESGVLPTGAYETLNDYGQYGWGNPCLETLGEGTRDLQFKVYVMERAADINEGDPGNEAWDTLAASSVDNATVLMSIEGSG